MTLEHDNQNPQAKHALNGVTETYIAVIEDSTRVPGGYMENADVAAIFYEVADLLELQGVAFKPIAYRKAASSIEQLEEPIARVAEEGRLREIPGVGESIVKKIEEVLKTGKLNYLETLRTEVPAGLKELVAVPEVGPKTAMILFKELGVANCPAAQGSARQSQAQGP